MEPLLPVYAGVQSAGTLLFLALTEGEKVMAQRVAKQDNSVGSAPEALKKSGAAVVPAASSWGFVKVYREPLEHPMFRGHLDWIGAWLLIQAAANYKTHHVILTDVGRRVARDFGWDNEKWRRFVKRLAKEGFIKIVETRNLGDKIGHRQIAVVLSSDDQQSEVGSTSGATRGATLERKGHRDGNSSIEARSGEGNGEVPNDGAEGGVLKEQRSKKEEGVVVVDFGEDAEGSLSHNNYYSAVAEKIDKESYPEAPVAEDQNQSNAAHADEDQNEESQMVRQFLANLVGGNFVRWLDRKIGEGSYRKDLFEYWCEEYREQELEHAWQLAQNVRNHRNDYPFGERLTFVDLLNGNIAYSDRAELRVWVEKHKKAKEEERLSAPLHYSNEGATKAFPEVVAESNKLPSVIDVFEDESLAALRLYVRFDEVKRQRSDAAHSLLPRAREYNIYYLINAAPNPKVGVGFHLHYLVNSNIFSGDETELRNVLKTLEAWNMIGCHMSERSGFVECLPLDASKWKVPQPQ